LRQLPTAFEEFTFAPPLSPLKRPTPPLPTFAGAAAASAAEAGARSFIAAAEAAADAREAQMLAGGVAAAAAAAAVAALPPLQRMVSTGTQTIDSELAPGAPARRYIHPAEESAGPGPAPAPQAAAGTAAAREAEEEEEEEEAHAARPVKEREGPELEDGPDQTWYAWWVKSRLC